MLTLWHSVQTFGACGAHSSTPLASISLPAEFASICTPLPADAQLSLLLARASHLQPEQLVDEGRLVQQEQAPPSAHASVVSQASMSSEALFASGNIGLMPERALLHAAQPSAVQQLLPDPGDPRRVAFSLACGACGVSSYIWVL